MFYSFFRGIRQVSLHLLWQALRRQQIHPKRSALMSKRCSKGESFFYLLKPLDLFCNHLINYWKNITLIQICCCTYSQWIRFCLYHVLEPLFQSPLLSWVYFCFPAWSSESEMTLPLTWLPLNISCNTTLTHSHTRIHTRAVSLPYCLTHSQQETYPGNCFLFFDIHDGSLVHYSY